MKLQKKVKDIRTNFLKKNPDRKFNEHDMRNDEIKADAFGEQIAKKNNSHSGKEISSTIIHSKFNKKINDDLYKNTSNIVKRDTYGNAIKNKNGKNQLITQFSRENIRLKKFEKLISEYNQYIFDSKKKIKQLSKELSISDKSDTQKISDLTNKIKNLQKNVTLYETKKNEVIQARNRVKNIIQAIKNHVILIMIQFKFIKMTRHKNYDKHQIVSILFVVLKIYNVNIKHDVY